MFHDLARPFLRQPRRTRIVEQPRRLHVGLIAYIHESMSEIRPRILESLIEPADQLILAHQSDQAVHVVGNPEGVLPRRALKETLAIGRSEILHPGAIAMLWPEIAYRRVPYIAVTLGPLREVMVIGRLAQRLGHLCGAPVVVSIFQRE